MLADWELEHEGLFRQIHDKAFQEEYTKMPCG